MVVRALGDDVVVTGESHSEVEGLVLGVLVVVGIVLVTVRVLRGHVMVSGVLIVVRVSLVGVALVVLVSSRVVSLVVGSGRAGVCLASVANRVGSVGRSVVGSNLVMNNGHLVVDNSLVVRGLVMDGDDNVSSLVVHSRVLVEVSQVSSLGMSNYMRCLVVDGGSNVMGCLVVDRGDSGVVSSCTVMSASNVRGFVMGNDGGLMLNMDGVLDVVHRGVSSGLVMSDVRVLGVVRLGHFLVNGLVMSSNRHVLDNGHRHVGSLVVDWHFVNDGVLVEMSQMSGLMVDWGSDVMGRFFVMDRSGNVVRSLMVHRSDCLVMCWHGVMENRRVQMVRILMGNNSLVVDWRGNVVRCFMVGRGSNMMDLLVMRYLVVDSGGNVVG